MFAVERVAYLTRYYPVSFYSVIFDVIFEYSLIDSCTFIRFDMISKEGNIIKVFQQVMSPNTKSFNLKIKIRGSITGDAVERER